MLVSVLGDPIGEVLELGFHQRQQAELAMERFLALLVEGQPFQPGQMGRAEQIAGGSFDQTMVEDGVDAVLEAGAVCHQHRAAGALPAHVLGFRIGNPDTRQVVAAQH